MIDNYDSFTYNLVDYIASAGAEVRAERNDAITPDDASGWAPTHLVVSPGPGTPREAGISAQLIERFGGRIPILGRVPRPPGDRRDVRRPRRPGGAADARQADLVSHDGSPLYAGLPSPFEAGRYHSLAALEVPDVLAVTARTPDGEVMGVRHREHPTHGVQFHPESVLTPHGRTLIENFLQMEASRR